MLHPLSIVLFVMARPPDDNLPRILALLSRARGNSACLHPPKPLRDHPVGVIHRAIFSAMSYVRVSDWQAAEAIRAAMMNMYSVTGTVSDGGKDNLWSQQECPASFAPAIFHSVGIDLA